MSRQPHSCPVCGGRGEVLDTLYSPYGTASTAYMVTCRSCNGTGIVWEPGWYDEEEDSEHYIGLTD